MVFKTEKITNFDQQKFEPVQVEAIENLQDQIQADIIADKFSSVSNEYKQIDRYQINIPKFSPESIPIFYPGQIKKKLDKIKQNKASVPGDIPAKVIKTFSKYLSIPICDILNNCIRQGKWPDMYKVEAITPIPKKYPPLDVNMLRPISLLYHFEKVMESLIGDLMIQDMKHKLDPAMFGNRKHISINHYLIKMLNRIVSALDNSSKGPVNEVLGLFIDYQAAFSRMCHTLGVKSYIENGVRPSLIPCLISYYEDREMYVRWHGHTSEKKKMPGSGAMGATLGILEFLSQTNENSKNVPMCDRYKYFDDLTTLEIINLISVGLSSYNVKNQIPSDLPSHGQFIESRNLLSQKYLQDINTWSEDHQMVLNQSKTKAMIFNFTRKHQFHTRLTIKDEQIEIVDKIKLLGTIITNDLSWDQNCNEIISKVNKRMQLLQKCKEIGSNNNELVMLWIIYCRSILENSSVVWSSSLTNENINDLERTQKSFCKMTLGKKYFSYENALLKLNLTTLEERRKLLNLKFATNAVKFQTMDDLFLKNKNEKYHTRHHEFYEVFNANTERRQKSSIIQMQYQLNEV